MPDRTRRKRIYPFVRKAGSRLKTTYTFYRQHPEILSVDSIFDDTSSVYPAPSLTSISLSLADVDGGAFVTATGTNLDVPLVMTVGGTAVAVTNQTPTSLTFYTPAKPTGFHNVVATSNGGASNALALEFWHPGAYALTMYLRDYTGSGGWTDRASAGTSGTRSLIATNVSAGTTVSGKTPAHFNGTSSQFDSGGAFGGGSLFNLNAGSIFILFKKNVSWTDFGDNGTGIDGNGIWRNPIVFSTGYTMVSCSDTRVRAATHHASPWAADALFCDNDDWALVQYRFNGATENFRLNNSNLTGLTKGGIDAFEDTFFKVGPSTDTPIEWFGGDILCMFTANTTFTDAQFDKILTWARIYYGLALTASTNGLP